MARKLRGNTTMDMVNSGITQRNKPIVLNNSTTTFSQLPIGFSQQPSSLNYSSEMKSPMQPLESKSPMIRQSFEKMGLGSIGGRGGRMGQLEQASMRLAQAASNRRMDESEQEYGLRGALASQEAALKGGLLGQEYGLRGGLAQTESDITARSEAVAGGYSSPFEMQADIARRRRDNENKIKEQESIAKRASREPQVNYTIDRRGRRVYS